MAACGVAASKQARMAHRPWQARIWRGSASSAISKKRHIRRQRSMQHRYQLSEISNGGHGAKAAKPSVKHQSRQQQRHGAAIAASWRKINRRRRHQRHSARHGGQRNSGSSQQRSIGGNRKRKIWHGAAKSAAVTSIALCGMAK